MNVKNIFLPISRAVELSVHHEFRGQLLQTKSGNMIYDSVYGYNNIVCFEASNVPLSVDEWHLLSVFYKQNMNCLFKYPSGTYEEFSGNQILGDMDGVNRHFSLIISEADKVYIAESMLVYVDGIEQENFIVNDMLEIELGVPPSHLENILIKIDFDYIVQFNVSKGLTAHHDKKRKVYNVSFCLNT